MEPRATWSGKRVLGRSPCSGQAGARSAASPRLHVPRHPPRPSNASRRSGRASRCPHLTLSSFFLVQPSFLEASIRVTHRTGPVLDLRLMGAPSGQALLAAPRAGNIGEGMVSECLRRGPASIVLFLFPERLEFRTCLGEDHVSMGLSKMNSKAEKRHLKKTDHLEGKTFQG